MEFILVVLVTSFFLLLIGFSIKGGWQPVSRMTREQALITIKGIEDKTTSRPRWEMFVGAPIFHDEELEKIRKKLVNIHEGLENESAASEGLDDFIYDREGRSRVAKVATQLEELIQNGPADHFF